MDDSRDVVKSAMHFDTVAEAYERHRPTYPEGLVDAVCEAAGLQSGDRVLEIGCGPGQLTSALVARGLQVTAVEPGQNLIDRARARVGADAVRFLRGRFEEVALDGQRFSAVFSATAFHWVDPSVGWVKAASVLKPGGALVLITHCSGADADSIEHERGLFDSVAAIAPDLATSLPRPRQASEVLEGAETRRGNISELWSWIGQFELARPEAAELFADVRVFSEVVSFDWTAERLNAQRGTNSLAVRLGPERLKALEQDTHRIFAGHGGELRLPTLVVAAVARRAGPGD